MENPEDIFRKLKRRFDAEDAENRAYVEKLEEERRQEERLAANTPRFVPTQDAPETAESPREREELERRRTLFYGSGYMPGVGGFPYTFDYELS